VAITASTVFLKMKGVERVQPPRQAQRFDEPLGGLDFMSLAGILAQDLAQHDPLSDGEGAQHLGGPAVLEVIETAAQRLAIEGDDGGVLGQRQSVGAKIRGDLIHIQPLQGVADRTVGGRPPPAAAERLVQPRLMSPDELMNPAVRGCSAHHRQDTEQQQVGEIVQLPLRATVIRNRQQALF
jgi:hypothetical protein